MCNYCGGKGVFKVSYHDGSPTDYAICLCPAAKWFRSDENGGRRTGYYGWQVWAYQNQIDPELVAPLEDILSADELAAAGFGSSGGESEADLIALGRRKVKL